MRDSFLLAGRQRADGATLTIVYVLALTVIPAKLVVKGVPLSITPATLVALTATIFWLCAHLSSTLGMAKGSNPIRTVLYLYALSLIASYCYGTYNYLSPDEVNLADHRLVLIIALPGVALLISDGVVGRHRVDVVLKAVAVGCAIVAVVGAVQFVLDLDLTKYLVLPGLKYDSTADGFVYARADFRRVAGTTGNPIEFGVLCAMSLPIALHYGFRAKGNGDPSWRWWVCSSLIASGLLFSVSRSAVLGIASAGAVLLAGWPARRRLAGLGVSAGFLVLTKLAFPGLIGTFLGLFTNFSSDDSVQYRTHDYPIAAAEIAKSPWLGRGVGTFYAPKHIVFDNQYLLTLVESGIVGFVILVGLFVVGMFGAARVRFRSTDPDDRDLALTMIACLIVPAVGSVTFDLLSFKTVEGILFVILGCVASLYRTSGTVTDGAVPTVAGAGRSAR